LRAAAPTRTLYAYSVVDARARAGRSGGARSRALDSRAVTDPLPLALDALYLALRLSLPALAVAFLVALSVGFLQSLTQLREPALNAIPRLLGVGLVLALSAGLWASELTSFAARVYRALPELVR
jgi:flagellar biosynthetic protein FliQ